jgi:DNA-binding PadR family transcriptional regulator
MPRSSRFGESGLRRENDPLLLVLMSLTTGPKHGHALIRDIEQLMDIRLGPGTLYGAITRLEEQGLIEALEPEDRRRPYRITDAGIASISQMIESMEAVVKIGRSRLASSEPLRRFEVQPG